MQCISLRKSLGEHLLDVNHLQIYRRHLCAGGDATGRGGAREADESGGGRATTTAAPTAAGAAGAGGGAEGADGAGGGAEEAETHAGTTSFELLVLGRKKRDGIFCFDSEI